MHNNKISDIFNLKGEIKMFKYITHNKKLFYLTLLTAPIAVGFDIGLAWLLRIITDAGTNGEEQLLPRLILISVFE